MHWLLETNNLRCDWYHKWFNSICGGNTLYWRCKQYPDVRCVKFNDENIRTNLISLLSCPSFPSLSLVPSHCLQILPVLQGLIYTTDAQVVLSEGLVRFTLLVQEFNYIQTFFTTILKSIVCWKRYHHVKKIVGSSLRFFLGKTFLREESFLTTRKRSSNVLFNSSQTFSHSATVRVGRGGGWVVPVLVGP